MLKTVRKAFQIEDIRKRIFYTFVMLVIVRLGSQASDSGGRSDIYQGFLHSRRGTLSTFLKRSPEARLQTFPFLPLSITPYINASIIMQLLTIAIPKLEEMQKEGEEGRKKIAAITRYVTVALALIESTAMAVGFGRQGLLEEYNFRKLCSCRMYTDGGKCLYDVDR